MKSKNVSLQLEKQTAEKQLAESKQEQSKLAQSVKTKDEEIK